MKLLPFFHQILKFLILFILYFKSYKRYMLSVNWKHVQYVKIYMPCNFEVNLITRLAVIALFFSSPVGELLSSLFVRCPSVNISHFNLLLRNHWANCNQTLVEWSLDGPLPKLCPVIPTSNQDGRQAKNRKKGGWNFNCPLLL